MIESIFRHLRPISLSKFTKTSQRKSLGSESYIMANCCHCGKEEKKESVEPNSINSLKTISCMMWQPLVTACNS